MAPKPFSNIATLIDAVEEILKSFDTSKWGEESKPGRTEAEQIVWATAEKEREGQFEELTRDQFFLRDPSTFDWSEIQQKAQQVADGEPLSHVLGFRYFNGRRYEVSPDVLTPRTETEGLLEGVLQRLGKKTTTGIEIGLGSGVLSIELLLHHPDLQMTATEVSDGAIAIAKKNAEKFAVLSRLKIVKASLDKTIFDSLRNQPAADFVISNPPYHEMDEEISKLVWNTEPQIALAALANPFLASQGNDSLYFIEPLPERVFTI